MPAHTGYYLPAPEGDHICNRPICRSYRGTLTLLGDGTGANSRETVQSLIKRRDGSFTLRRGVLPPGEPGRLLGRPGESTWCDRYIVYQVGKGVPGIPGPTWRTWYTWLPRSAHQVTQVHMVHLVCQVGDVVHVFGNANGFNEFSWCYLADFTDTQALLSQRLHSRTQCRSCSSKQAPLSQRFPSQTQFRSFSSNSTDGISNNLCRGCCC